MKNIFFWIFSLGVFALVGCNTVDAGDRIISLLGELTPPEKTDFENQLDYFEAKLDYFESVIEVLETEANELNPDDRASEIIHSESYALLGQVKAERDGYELYNFENFKRYCIEEGGVVISDTEQNSTWCEPLEIHNLVAEAERPDIWDRFRQLIPQTMAIEHLLLDSLDDFEHLLNVLEADLDEFEEEFDARLNYTEANDPELWNLIYYHNAHLTHWGHFMSDAHQFRYQIEAISVGLNNFTRLNGLPSRGMQMRIHNLTRRLNRIVQPFSVG